MNSSPYFKQLELGPMKNFIYLLGDPNTREAAVVDPGWEVETILKTVKEDGYTLTTILITHTHFDHTMGLGDLLKAVDVPIYVHEAEAHSLKVEGKSVKSVSGGNQLQIGQLQVNFLHTPGHTPGSQCLLVDNKLISGDTLFVNACGRCDLPGGDATQMYESFSKILKQLDDDTILCPGHNYGKVAVSSIGEEKRMNPFLQPETLNDFLHLVKA